MKALFLITLTILTIGCVFIQRPLAPVTMPDNYADRLASCAAYETVMILSPKWVALHSAKVTEGFKYSITMNEIAIETLLIYATNFASERHVEGTYINEKNRIISLVEIDRGDEIRVLYHYYCMDQHLLAFRSAQKNNCAVVTDDKAPAVRCPEPGIKTGGRMGGVRWNEIILR